MNLFDEIRCGRRAKNGGEKLLRLGRFESPQLHPLDASAPVELGQPGQQRVAAVQLVGPEGHDQDDAIRGELTDQERDRLAGGRIGPVQILDDEQDRAALGQALEHAQDSVEQPCLQRLRRGGGIRGGGRAERREPDERGPIWPPRPLPPGRRRPAREPGPAAPRQSGRTARRRRRCRRSHRRAPASHGRKPSPLPPGADATCRRRPRPPRADGSACRLRRFPGHVRWLRAPPHVPRASGLRGDEAWADDTGSPFVVPPRAGAIRPSPGGSAEVARPSG